LTWPSPVSNLVVSRSFLFPRYTGHEFCPSKSPTYNIIHLFRDITSFFSPPTLDLTLIPQSHLPIHSLSCFSSLCLLSYTLANLLPIRSSTNQTTDLLWGILPSFTHLTLDRAVVINSAIFLSFLIHPTLKVILFLQGNQPARSASGFVIFLLLYSFYTQGDFRPIKSQTYMPSFASGCFFYPSLILHARKQTITQTKWSRRKHDSQHPRFYFCPKHHQALTPSYHSSPPLIHSIAHKIHSQWI
jgi:hypothetical protein